MAAALAASLPTPSAAPAPAAPTYEAIPSSMSTLIDVEAEIPLQCVQLDGLVVSKILKHACDSNSSSPIGLLLGLDLDGVLEVSNSFALPYRAGDDDDKSAKSVARYQASMLRSLKEVQGDDSIVGFYQASTLGAFFNQNLIDLQAIHQDKLRHGGVVVVHDISQTARGNASFRAFRLTTAFLDAYKKSSFSTSRFVPFLSDERDVTEEAIYSLASHQLTFSSILEELPLKIHTNPLLSAFLGEFSNVSPNTAPGSSASAIPPSFSVLDLNSGGLTQNLEYVVDALDNYRNEEGNLAYLSRQIARERAKADNYVMKRKEESAARVAQGLAPLPEEDVTRLFKIPSEPSRLESMLLLGQVDAYAKSLAETTSTGLVKMYAATAGSSV
ncbi:translation initiation factor 3 subunit 3 [Lentinula aciculospora]|uniref:Eukaryotic translation initiation factor 3 subunit H n=1 Tax=Lentinula aciculospora TaxID=153920 RepID=A0A9W9AP37_9AGAR|nr:translation initiation factor 3 subunit 3 [Lentinula aciculospora]